MPRAKEIKTLRVTGSPVRLDRFLHQCCPEISTNRWRRLIAAGELTVDGRRAAKGTMLRAGQQVSLAGSCLESGPAPEPDGELEIIYQDDDLLALNKAAACHTHPLTPAETGTLANHLLTVFPELAGIGDFGPLQPGMLNRLDFATSGIVLVARSENVWKKLRRQFVEHLIRKEYLAEAEGEIEAVLEVDLSLTHDRSDRRRMVVGAAPCRGLYPARTEIEPLSFDRARNLTTVRLVMYSGVMHQLRVHLAAVGHPLVGDRLYGGS
ncbi:MAG: RluA family pseudouridine synthase, partial [Deltaproteobacteria bacterium]|nr:RluA family pseudouridine synthase [Deltaproteobacteria bacterium]